jgi:hypothetical protein
MEGESPEGHLDGQGQLWIALAFNLFGCNWLPSCKITFNEDPYLLTLGNLRSFKQELALLLRVKT